MGLISGVVVLWVQVVWCQVIPPPYSVVVGNPWRIVKFVFTPEEIVEHEAKLYSEDERIPLDVLQRNYQKWMEGHR